MSAQTARKTVILFLDKKRQKMLSSPNPAPALSELPPSMKKVVMRAPRRICAVCNKTTNLRCSTCKVTFYCSVQCRDMNWASHAKECACVQEDEWSLLRSSARRIDFDANAKGPVLFMRWFHVPVACTGVHVCVGFTISTL